MTPAPARLSERIVLDLPADLRFLRIVGACVQELIGDDPVQHVLEHEIEIALHEICVNIVVHAYEGVSGGRLDLVLSRDGPELVVEIADRGKPFEPAAVTPPDLEHGQVHGYGVFMAHALLDEISYTRTHDGVNHWRVVKRWT